MPIEKRIEKLNARVQQLEQKLKDAIEIGRMTKEGLLQRLTTLEAKPFDALEYGRQKTMAIVKQFMKEHPECFAPLEAKPKSALAEDAPIEERESDKFDVDERFKAKIFHDVIVLYEKCASQIGEKEATFMFKQIPRSTFEKLHKLYIVWLTKAGA